MANKSVKQLWAEVPPKKRMLYVLGGGFLALMLLAVMLTPSNPTSVGKPKEKLKPVNLTMPGSNGRDLTIEKLAASVKAVQKEQATLGDNLTKTQKAALDKSSNPASASPETIAELQSMRAEIEELKVNQVRTPSLDEALPTGVQPMMQDVSSAPAEEMEDEPKLRVIVGGGQERTETEEEVVQKPKPLVYLPAGSNFEGVLLNGMDAPTSGVAQKNPVPALVRLKTDAILPNRYRYDVRECFAIVSGFGILSTERAQLQTVTLSCVKTDGQVIESKIEGYVVGEDGKVGMRGRLVSKQGSMLAKSFISGFASGIAQVMTPLAVPQVNTTGGSTTQFTTPTVSDVVTAGTAKGISESARMLSQFYLDVAKEMFPVVEIDANRRVTIILVNGVELNMQGDKK